MVKEEIWGVSLTRARAFFLAQPDVTALVGDNFSFGSCRICLTALDPSGVGIWSPYRTRIRFEGPEEEVHTIYRRFFLQFLSAGG